MTDANHHVSATPIWPLLAPVLIIEDEPIFQQRLERILLDLEFTPAHLNIADSVNAAQSFLSQQWPRFVLVDLGLPDGHGKELIQQLRNQDAELPILVISAWSSKETIIEALCAGATGYLLKERDDLELTLALRNVMRGGSPIDPFIAQHILHLLPVETTPTVTLVPASASALTQRETEILTLIANGLSNREIAEQLFISRYTVESHVKHIYRKLAVSSRVKAISEAREKGWIAS